jgi:RNA polymerase sigma-70 factor (ECF subfamily)
MRSARHARAALSLVRAPAEPEVSDAVLVARILSGEAASREVLYKRHVDYVSGMSARLLRSIDASQDVTQDAFVMAFERLSTLRDPAAFRGWLAAIAVSFVRRRLRKQRLLRALGLDGSHDDAALDRLAREDTVAETRSELAALDLVLQTLPANHRIAWMLRHVEGDALDDVAAACDCSLATAKRWISAADERVRAHLAWEKLP